MRYLFLPLLILTFACGCASEKQANRSPYTVAEVSSKIKPGMAVWEVKTIAQTTPVMVADDRFEWKMKDGTIWTNFKKENRQWKVTDVDTEVRAN